MPKTNTKPVNEAGIIGQMYEDRKTKKVGVIESRDTERKTLMMRANDGSTFNITYSTFHSNWRKYTGDEVIQTSTQVEEERAEAKKEVAEAKKELNKQAEKRKTVSPKVSTEEKIKAVKAMMTIVENHLKSAGSALKVSKKMHGGMIIRFNKYTVFELWIRHGSNQLDVFYRGHIIEDLTKDAKKALEALPSMEVVKVHDTWPLKYQYRFSQDNVETILDELIKIGDAYAETKKNEETQKNEKPEKKEKK